MNAFGIPALLTLLVTLAPAPRLEQNPFPKLSGSLIVANQRGATASLISLDRAQIVRAIPTGVGPHETAVSPSGKRAIVTNYGDQSSIGASLVLIDIETGKELKTVSLGSYTRPHGAAFVDENRVVVTSESTRNLVLVDLSAETVVRAFPTEEAGSHMLALGRDGKTVYSANIPSGTVTKFDVDSGKTLGVARVGKGSEGIALSPDGKWIATSNLVDQTVSLVETSEMKTVKTFPTPGLPYRAAFSTDGQKIYVPNKEVNGLHVVDLKRGEVSTIDLAKGPVQIPLLGGAAPIPAGIFIHPGGRYAFVTILNADSVAVVDLKDRAVVGLVKTGAQPDGVSFSPVRTRESN